MSCLHPRYIRVDNRDSSNCLNALSPRLVRYRDVRPSALGYMPVPCGKCINCLKARQNALVSRCLAESEKRGSFVFLTLTYDEEHLPFAQSLWRVSRETGEYELVDKGEIVISARSSRLDDERKHFQQYADKIRSDFRMAKLKCIDKTKPIYLESKIDGFSLMDDSYDYYSRLTPSVCREDVRLWLKSARVSYEREHGQKLSDFSYVAVSEYGPNTCRPHYHLAFFGLSLNEAIWLSDSWKYGYRMLKVVNRVNPDGSDGFAIASRYIGKYMTKGKFDCESVLDCSAEKPRLCQSKGIGSSLIEKVRSFMCGFDLFGEYDLDSLFCPSLKRNLNSDEVSVLEREIPKRLFYDAGNGYKLPIPRLFRTKVFYHEYYEKVPRRKFECRRRGASISESVEMCTQIRRKPTTLWSLVSDALREYLDARNSAEFFRYLSKRREGNLHEVVDNFAYFRNSCTQISEDASEASYINFLTKSVF